MRTKEPIGGWKWADSEVARQKEAAASVRPRLLDFEASWSQASSGYQNRAPCCRDDPFRKPRFTERCEDAPTLTCEEKRSPTVVEGSSRTSTPVGSSIPRFGCGKAPENAPMKGPWSIGGDPTEGYNRPRLGVS